MGLKKVFGKECVATQSSTMAPEEVLTLKREITKDVLDKVAALLQNIGVPHVDLANINTKDQQSQYYGDPRVPIEPTPERTPDTITPVAQNPEPIPEHVVKVHIFIIYKHLLI